METLFALLCGAAAWWLAARMQAKRQANHKTAFLSNFTGVVAVIASSPWDDTVAQRAKELEEGFVACANNKPRKVLELYYNNLMADHMATSRDFMAWQAEVCRQVLQEHAAFILEQQKLDSQAAAHFYGGQAETPTGRTTDWTKP